MKRSQEAARRPRLAPLLGAALAFPAIAIAAAGESPATVPQSSLHACAVMPSDPERLACYDQLAGRTAHSAAAPAAAAAAAATAAPAAALAPASASPPPPAAPSSSSVQPSTAAHASAAAPPSAASAGVAASSVAATAVSGAPSAAAAKDSFGLYTAEHPAPAVASSLEARVVELGRSASGHTTVALEGGAVWELDTADPLLGVGDLVTIRRASLGSFLLETPSKRTHRVRRLH